MTVTFRAVLVQAAGKQATGIEVPPAVIDELGGGKRPAVRVSLNGHEYRTTIGTMNGVQMIPVNAATRTAAGISAGDSLEVSLTLDTATREAAIPDDLAAAFAANPAAKAFFDTMSNSLQRYHVDNINGAKAADTRARRVDKAIELLAAKKSR